MSDIATGLRPWKPSVDELIAAHRELRRRVEYVTVIIRNVAQKTRAVYLPAGFTPLLRWDAKWEAHYRGAVVNIRFDRGSNLDFPKELLGGSDRDIATWARSRIKACRRNSFARARKVLTDDISGRERDLARLSLLLETKKRELSNLGAGPTRGA